jgi:hypothetical protein
MNTVRIERRWIREGVPRPRVELRGPMMAVASLCAVFACFYGVGRAMHAGKAARVEAAPSLSVASVSAAIPVRLSSAPPLDAAPEAGAASTGQGSRPNSTPTAPTQSEVFHAPLGLPQAAPAVSSAPVREQAAPEAHNSSPQPAPAAPSTETHSAPSQPAPAAAPPATSRAAGGHGLFDSSG